MSFLSVHPSLPHPLGALLRKSPVPWRTGTHSLSFCILVFSLCLCVSCAPKGSGGAGDTAERASSSNEIVAPPAGMRLGAQYISALGEQCYEVFPQVGAASQSRAYCLQSGMWTLLPDIFMTVPASGGL
jgi:hypothetical protein